MRAPLGHAMPPLPPRWIVWPQDPGDVLVRVTAVGVCGSDVKMYKGGDFYWGPGGRGRGRGGENGGALCVAFVAAPVCRRPLHARRRPRARVRWYRGGTGAGVG